MKARNRPRNRAGVHDALALRFPKQALGLLKLGGRGLIPGQGPGLCAADRVPDPGAPMPVARPPLERLAVTFLG